MLRRANGGSKDALLAVARKAADHVYDTFKSRDPNPELPLNPSIIMGAAELYRTAGDRKCLDMANLFIDRRGAAPRGCTDQNQNAVPLRKETQVVGHAVFFTHLFASAADAYMETGDRSLLEALERLWADLTEKRMYVTGGVCALHRGLAFTLIPYHVCANRGESEMTVWLPLY